MNEWMRPTLILSEPEEEGRQRPCIADNIGIDYGK